MEFSGVHIHRHIIAHAHMKISVRVNAHISGSLIDIVAIIVIKDRVIHALSVTVPFDMRMSKESEIYEIVNTDGGGYGV